MTETPTIIVNLFKKKFSPPDEYIDFLPQERKNSLKSIESLTGKQFWIHTSKSGFDTSRDSLPLPFSSPKPKKIKRFFTKIWNTVTPLTKNNRTTGLHSFQDLYSSDDDMKVYDDSA